MRRSAFTIIELLVSIGILAFLVSLLAIAIAPSLENAKIESTRSTIEILSGVVQSKIDVLSSMSTKNERMHLQARYKNATGANMPDAVAHAIVASSRYCKVLPQRREDLFGINGVVDPTPGLIDDSYFLSVSWDRISNKWDDDSWIVRNGTDTNSPIQPSDGRSIAEQRAESSELLYMSLTTYDGVTDIVLKPGSIPGKHIGDTDGDGNLEFIDDWGNPLQFYNSTTRLIKPDGMNVDLGLPQYLIPRVISSVDLNTDDFDPAGLVGGYTTFHSDIPQSPLGNDVASSLPDAKGYGEEFHRTRSTLNRFMIVSWGPDEDTGIGIPAAYNSGALRAQQLAQPLSDPSASIDDITNWQ